MRQPYSFAPHLQPGETLLWQGRTHGLPLSYWMAFFLFLTPFIAVLAVPLIVFLGTGELILNIEINGQAVTDATPRPLIVSSLLGVAVLYVVLLGLLIFFTLHRWSRHYAVTNEKLIEIVRFGFEKARFLPLASVVRYDLRRRGSLCTATFQYLPDRSFLQQTYGVGQMVFHDFRDPEEQFQRIIGAAITDVTVRQSPQEALS